VLSHISGSGVRCRCAVMPTDIGLTLITSFAVLWRSAEVAPFLIWFRYQVVPGSRLPSQTAVTRTGPTGSWRDRAAGMALAGQGL